MRAVCNPPFFNLPKNRTMTLKEITNFCEQNKVEIVRLEDMQLHCFINYKKGDGSYAHGINAIAVIQQAIKRYLETKSS